MKEKENPQLLWTLYLDLEIINVLLHLFPPSLLVNGVFYSFSRLCATNWDKQNPFVSFSLLGSLQPEKAFSFFSFFFFNIFLMLFIFWGRETEHEQGRGRERERDTHTHTHTHTHTQNPKQAPSCQHRTRCGARTHGLWDHDLSWTQTLNRLSHPGAPILFENLETFT